MSYENMYNYDLSQVCHQKNKTNKKQNNNNLFMICQIHATETGMQADWIKIV